MCWPVEGVGTGSGSLSPPGSRAPRTAGEEGRLAADVSLGWSTTSPPRLSKETGFDYFGCPLVIQCKNFRIVHFIVPRERDCHDIYNSLLQLSKQAKYEDLYAFSYNPKQNDSEQIQGWQLIDLSEEYKRMGVPDSNWQLSDANREYKICETYPRELYVPRIASKPIIVGSSKFRSKGRFPVLSYYHQKKEAAICRCSQPLSGFSARCLEDKHLLQAISKANPVNPYMYVVDTRPKLNAMANRAAGKGYE
ncbi:myotubularin-related protein 6-like [Sorex fumeus]|uniref:myotubularin-related protein 6-like n=1 Tax=Sorex fumeus TaxID=62283 RepID=UPI0024AE70E1|nr:myotubularin-related protein 6-like [Sorex fumeus]